MPSPRRCRHRQLGHVLQDLRLVMEAGWVRLHLATGQGQEGAAALEVGQGSQTPLSQCCHSEVAAYWETCHAHCRVLTPPAAVVCMKPQPKWQACSSASQT